MLPNTISNMENMMGLSRVVHFSSMRVTAPSVEKDRTPMLISERLRGHHSTRSLLHSLPCAQGPVLVPSLPQGCMEEDECTVLGLRT